MQGNCGYKPGNSTELRRCGPGDERCGLLHCRNHRDTSLAIGLHQLARVGLYLALTSSIYLYLAVTIAVTSPN